jgi:tetratricopeptide (TPR) repeat protein
VWPLCWVAGAAMLLFAIALLTSDTLAGSFKRSAESGDIETVVHRYRLTVSDSLPGFNIDLYASRAMAQMSLRGSQVIPKLLARQEALRAGERAARTAEDRQNAFFNLAQLYAQQDDAARTERNLRLAIEAAPQWFKPHWILAELLKRTGRLAEAREQARLAMTEDAGKDLEIVHAWEALGSPR